MGRITLTFDNGPTAEVTPSVLAMLAVASVRAHFFVLGKHVATDVGRALVRDIVAAGHFVGNHSFTHETPLGDDLGDVGDNDDANDDSNAGAGAVARELEATRLVLEPLLPPGDLPRRFRPFGGGGVLGPHLLSPAAVAWLAAHQHSCVLWNCVPGDWRDPVGWVDVALAEVARVDHAVVVLHDVDNACLPGLPRFLAAARAAGAEFVDSFPSACVPVVAGVAHADLTPFVRRRPLLRHAPAAAGVDS